MGEANDLTSGIAESPVYTVTVRAVGPGNGNLAIPDSDDVGTGFVGDGEFLVLPEVDGPDQLTPAGHFRQLRRGAGGEEKQAQTNASDDQTKKQDAPIF